MGYPSLQGSVEFERVEDVVPVLDAMVVRLRHLDLHLRSVVADLERLPVKRRGRFQRDMAIATLIREADKSADNLAVYGFGDGLTDNLAGYGFGDGLS